MQKMIEFGPSLANLEKSYKSSGREVSPKQLRDSISKASLKFNEQPLLADNVVYSDAMNGFDGRDGMRKALTEATGFDFTKAIAISGITAGTQDKSLIPLYVDPTIVDITRRLTPLVELIPRVTNYGRTAEYNRLTGRGVGGFQAEDAAMTEADDTYARASTAVKFAYAVGRVTGPFLAASRQYLSNQYIDALNLEVRNKTITLRYIEEDAIINGDATTTRTAYGGGTTGSGLEFSGLRKLVSTNNQNLAGAALTIDYLRKAIRDARTAAESTTLGQGDPNLMVTDYVTTDNIKKLIQDYNRYVNINYEVGWGMKSLEFEGLPVLPTKFMPTTSNQRELLCLSTDTLQMRVLQDVTYEDLAKTNDSYKFMIKMYEAMICTAEEFNSKITYIHD